MKEIQRKCGTRFCHNRASGIWLKPRSHTYELLCAQHGFDSGAQLVQSLPTTHVTKIVDPAALPKAPDVTKLVAVRLAERNTGETVKTFIYEDSQ